MTKINYQALREAAEKATCGAWSLEYGEERFDAGDALIHREVVGYLPICRIEGAHPESGFDEDFQMEQQANAEFIAAANPATVLALLDELETAKKRIAELKAEPVSQTYKLNQLSGNSPVTPDGWISCSDRMPEKGQNVLISVNFDSSLVEPLICSARYTGSTFRRGEATIKPGNGIEQATHWMPLPEPPQEVNRG
ncbi:ead/Ea22-like family protein [Escherichia coli]|uniref:ead/Ea22-like family protein n=1 Tax=Escherichia coli TaxID=562 RepID=UPI00197D068B|nr:ead/Ea22-like family protein [Escherichia coli]MBN6174007.1 ead/Ea22-like family protein [Escherichia coli]